MGIGISKLEPDSAPQNLSTLALISFSALQFLLAWGYVGIYTHLFGLTAETSAPYRALAPSLLYLLAAFATVRLFQFVLRADLWSRSPFCSGNSRAAALAAGFAGFLPMAAHLAAALLFFHAKVQWRPPSEPFVVAPFLIFLVVCCLNAGTEELVFRNVPVALAGNRRTILAFLIPSLVFVLVHFLTPNHVFSFWRVMELLSASLFFFVIVLDQGLVAATLAHTAWNLGIFLTDGSWGIGALVDVHWAGSKQASLFGNCVSLWAVTVLYLLISARVKQKRAFPRDYTLRLTPA